MDRREEEGHGLLYGIAIATLVVSVAGYLMSHRSNENREMDENRDVI